MKRTEKNGEKGYVLHFDPLPLLYALPGAVLMLLAAFLWGRDLRNMLHVLIKLVVRA